MRDTIAEEAEGETTGLLLQILKEELPSERTVWLLYNVVYIFEIIFAAENKTALCNVIILLLYSLFIKDRV